MKVAVIQYTNLPPECDSVRQNLFDLTKFRLQVPCGYQFELLESDDFSATLDELADFHWAVLVATGTYFFSGDTMFDTIMHGLEHNSPMVCHIIDKEGYTYAHPQWLAINLQVWRSIGSPRFENTGTVSFEAPVVQKTFRGGAVRNKQSIRANYKPQEIRAGSQTATVTIGPQEFGARVIAGLLAAGYSVVNVPEEVRQRKFYSYPEFLYPTIQRMIEDPNFSAIEHESLQVFNAQIQQLRENLSLGYYPVNTEKLHNINQTYKLDCFAGVCGGIKPAWITGADNFRSHGQVLLFDISPAAIAYQKYLLANWDGDLDKLEIAVQAFQAENPEYRAQYFKDMGLRQNLYWCFDNDPAKAQEFQRRWKKYQQHDIVFERLDLFDQESRQRISNWINQSKLGSYIWPSNSFCMDYLMFYKGSQTCADIELEFKRVIMKDAVHPVVWDDRHAGHRLT